MARRLPQIRLLTEALLSLTYRAPAAPPLRGRALPRPSKALGTLTFSDFTLQHIKYVKMHPHPILNVIFAIKFSKDFYNSAFEIICL